MKTVSIWEKISTDYICTDNECVYVDAWKIGSNSETSVVIAKVKKPENIVTYFDERAKTDEYAQSEIQKVIKERNILW